MDRKILVMDHMTRGCGFEEIEYLTLPCEMSWWWWW